MKKTIIVNTDTTMDARPLAELVGKANEFSSRISFTIDGRSVNAKSIMGVMGLGIDLGKEIVIDAQGEDENDAVSALCEFLGA